MRLLILLIYPLFFACSATATSTRAPDHLPPARSAAIQSYLIERYTDHAAGISAVVFLDGEQQLLVNRGYANIEWKIRSSEHAAYRIGSISKPITAVALLQLYERGVLELHAPIATYIPDLPAHIGRVTAFQLLSHTSGLPDHVFDEDLMPFIRSGMSFDQILEMHKDTPINNLPGATYEYVNFNYTLLGHLLSVLSGLSYSDYVEQHVFGPLGMADSASDDRRDIVPRRVQNYDISDGLVLHTENVDMSHVGAAGQLLSSPSDLALWFQSLIDGQLIAKDTLALAWTEVIPADGKGGGYGLGFNIRERNGERFVFHTGLTPGSHAAVGVYPGRKLLVAITCNGFYLPSTGSAMFWIADELLGASSRGARPS